MGVSVPWVAKTFGPAKPLLLRVAIASPSNKPWSCHNASAWVDSAPSAYPFLPIRPIIVY
jgi:hypothetical protein